MKKKILIGSLLLVLGIGIGACANPLKNGFKHINGLM